MPGVCGAQAPEPLGAALARSADGFTYIFDVRELPDGRVLLTDSRDKSIALVDFTAGNIEYVGRHGRGPREYLSASTIIPRQDGTSAVYDAVQRRLSIVSSAGEMVEVESFEPPPFSGFSAPRGPDRQGRWYVDRRSLDGIELRRRAVVYRWNPATGAVDSVMTAMQYARGQEGVGFVPMPFGDAWSFLPDGSVVRLVAEEDYYHAEWSDPNGAISIGPRIPFDGQAVGRREREAWVSHMLRRSGGSVRLEGHAASPSRAQVARTLAEIDPDRFPDQVPPFEVGYAPASPAGDVWLRVSGSGTGNETVFDLVGRSGTLVRRVSVPGSARVVGFGSGTVYLALRDEVDLEWLVRFGYPGA